MSYKTTLILGMTALLISLAWLVNSYRGLSLGEAPYLTPPQEDVSGTTPSLDGDTGSADTAERRSQAPKLRGLQVVDFSGTPQPQFLVLLLTGGELLFSARTDLQGRVEHAANLAPEEVLLCRSNHRVVRRTVDSTAEDQQVALPAGARVGGHVLLDGEGGLVELWLTSDRAEPALKGLSEGILQTLLREGVRPSRLSVTSDQDGGFSFGGLAANWTGAIELPGAYYFAAEPAQGDLEGEAALLLLEPTEGLSLELGEARQLRGRTVEAKSGEPLQGVSLRGWSPLPSCSVGPPGLIQTDEAGYFEVFLRGVQARRGEWRLRLECALNGAREESYSFGPEDVSNGDDLGDLRIELGRTLSIQVLEPGGGRLTGALLRAAGDGVVAAGQTDAEGLGQLPGILPEMETVRVFAPGYGVAEVAIPEGDELVVELTSSNHLEVRVVDRDGRPMEGLKLRVRCDEQPFNRALEGSRLASKRRFRQSFELEEGGRLSLGELRPGLLLNLAVVDNLGGQLGQQDVYTPGAAEHVVKELVVDVLPFHISGRVTDPTGRPLPRVAVHAEGEGFTLSARTDAEGRFALGSLLTPAEAMHLEFSRPGFMTEALNELSFEPNSAPLEIVLAGGRPLEVECLDMSGRPISVAWITATFEGSSTRIGLRREGSNLYTFEAVPRVPGQVTLTLGGVEFSEPLNAEETSLRVEIEGIGVLHVIPDPDLAAGEREFINLVSQPLDGDSVAGRAQFRRKPGGLTPVELSLPIGRYSLQVERRVPQAGGAKIELLGEAIEVTIVAGAPCVVILP